MKSDKAKTRWKKKFSRSMRQRLEEKVGHSTLFKDKVYTPDDWAWHKSWRRFYPQWLTTFRVLWGFAGVALFHVFFAVCVCIYHAWLVNIGAPSFWNRNLNLWQPFSLSSFCLALLLVHRVTSTYQRWWEARTVWGQVLNMSRNLIRQCGSPWGFPAHERPLLEMMARCTIAMPYLLRAHLHRESPSELLETFLLHEEVEEIMGSTQPCLRVAQMASAIIGQAMPGPEYQQTRCYFDEQVALYVNCVGACERIYKTPVPHAFSRHLTRFLSVWLFFLPFALWPVYGWATPFIELVLAYLLIGTENIAIQIEEPFSIMPLSEFCASAEASVVETMDGLTGALRVTRAVKSSRLCHGYRRHAKKPPNKTVRQSMPTEEPAPSAKLPRKPPVPQSVSGPFLHGKKLQSTQNLVNLKNCDQSEHEADGERPVGSSSLGRPKALPHSVSGPFVQGKKLQSTQNLVSLWNGDQSESETGDNNV